MTVREYCLDQVSTAESCAKKAETKKMSISFMDDADKWMTRAADLSDEDAVKDVDDVILWRIFEKQKEGV
jgi:hypothetical protein